MNPPLDFELKGLDATHSYFERAKLRASTIARFGLGYCARGLLQDRVAIPIHDVNGKCVGYAGAAIDSTETQYVFPADRERHGAMIHFRRELLLYNVHRIGTQLEDLVVVEEFAHAWWLHQAGYTAVVATMAPSCSEEQVRLLLSRLSYSGRIWLMSNGQEKGAQFARSVLEVATPHRLCRWVKLEGSLAPTDLSEREVGQCFNK